MLIIRITISPSLDHLQVLEGLDAVLDVGGVYDPSRDRYDHHQKGFQEVFGHGFTTKLSSAGLVYKVITNYSSRKMATILAFCVWLTYEFCS